MTDYRKQFISFAFFLVPCLVGSCAYAQQQTQEDAQPAQSSLHAEQTMVVLGSATAIPLAESPRAVTVLPLENLTGLEPTPVDVLRSDTSIFLEQRGAGGAQADVTLRGGSFEQTLVLLNGFRINDSQTSHHNLDLPVPLEAMQSIEVLHGAGSTLHGADALAGVVDFLTAAPSSGRVEISTGAGSFGLNEESLLAEAVRHWWSGRVTGSHNLSTGFMPDRDYRNEDASNEDWLSSRLGLTDLLFAVSDRSFGADNFYGTYPSWERTKGWFASARQEIGEHTHAAFGYRRHSDEFVLVRYDPALYENNHIDTSWQATLRHNETIRSSSTLLIGAEVDGDSIHSNNLGDHARNRAAGYIDLDLHPAKEKWNLTAGAREEGFSGGPTAVFAPHLAGSYLVAATIKLRASAGYGYRIPTYTDLYYSDPTTIGNPNLKPESAWSGDAGVDWNPGTRLSVATTGFYSRQHDSIDYVRVAEQDPWQAVNLSGLSFTGVEAKATWKVARNETVRFAWTGLHGTQGALHGLESEYVFNYPVQNGRFEWDAALGRQLEMHTSVQIAQRYLQDAYPVWNVAFTRTPESGHWKWLSPYVRLENLSNTGYQEIDGVNMPGRSITGGVTIRLGS
ncbi:TonB-dependent receptor plug domain-containing protein [Acidicapsa dinghuensis]|uniref:TonB-dependent receptor plug domain-containing protein n=1 Tax=Acidicapsa dinghuensis TaxID=2218256 RepID=A0ABW1EBY5_9BACT|nr:TonB-dependent receptor [Acidicapsa dinghuensis]